MSPDLIQFGSVGYLIQSQFNTLNSSTVHYSMVYECEACGSIVTQNKIDHHRNFHRQLNRITIGV